MKESYKNIIFNCIFIAIFIVLLALGLYILSIIPIGVMFCYIVKHHINSDDNISDVQEEVLAETPSSEDIIISSTEELAIKKEVEDQNVKKQEEVVNNAKVEAIIQRIQQDKAMFEKKKAAASFDWKNYAAMCNAHLEHMDEMDAYKNDDRYKDYV